jgi:SAM-dependent methyltransferase
VDEISAGGGATPVDDGSREHYEDALLYDYEYRRRRHDVLFYRELSRELLGDHGSVLELACGSGRVTTALVRAGHQVIGLDLSAPMLARAQARIAQLGRAARERALFVRGDMRRFALGRRFRLIVMAFNSFEHLYTRVEVAACLACVREHLTEDGVFAFGVQNPDLSWLCRDPGRRWARTKFRHPGTGQRMEYSTNHVYDPVSQIVVIRLYYEPIERPGTTRVVHLSQRKFFPAELEALLFAGGFTLQARYGDFARDPLDGDAASQVLVCRRSPTESVVRPSP